MQSNLDFWTDLVKEQIKAYPTYTPSQPTHKQDVKFIITPKISIHPDQLYLYGQIDWVVARPPNSKNSIDNLKLNNNRGVLSDKAKKKAKRAISYLLTTAKEKKVYNPKFDSYYRFKVNFITLTLSGRQQHSDSEIKNKLLNQFLVEAKDKWGLKNYVWKAERQKNGNIHFHILSDCFIPWQELRDVWNRIQSKLGYLQAYRKSFNHGSPNSTDVHSLRKIKNIPAYVVKYMIKETPFNHVQVHRNAAPNSSKSTDMPLSMTSGVLTYLRSISNSSRIWSCSHSLSNLTGAVAEVDTLIQDEVDRLCKQKAVRRVDKEHFSLVFFDYNLINPVDYPLINGMLQCYLQTVFPPSYYMAES